MAATLRSCIVTGLMGDPPAPSGIPSLSPPRLDAVDGPWTVTLVPWELRPPSPSLTVVVEAVATTTEQGLELRPIDEADVADEHALALQRTVPIKPRCDVVVVAGASVPSGPVGLRFGPDPGGLSVERVEWGARAIDLTEGGGTFDARWRRSAWPFFPPDFDWSAVQCAPPAQRCALARGDEAFHVTGRMRGDGGWVGRLPGIVPRLLWRLDETVHDVVPHLDTVVFDLDTSTVRMVWRAVIERPRTELERLAWLAVAILDRSESAEALAARLAGVEEAAPPPPAAALAPRLAWSSDPPDDEEEEGEPAGGESSEADPVDELVAKVHALVPGAAPVAPDEVAAAPPAPEVSEEGLRAAGLDAEQAAGLLAMLAPPPPPEPRDEAPDVEASEAPPPPAPPGPGGEHRAVDWRGRDLRGLALEGIQLQGAMLDEVDLTGADLRGADLTDASLRGARLRGAILDRARLEGAALADADLSAVRAEGACFDRAVATRASFEGAVLEATSFLEADLTRSHFARSRLIACDFSRASLARAVLFDVESDARFEGAVLTGVAADGARMAGAHFDQATLDESCWRGGTFDDASFLHASLQSAVLTGSRARRGGFARADLRGGKLDGCDLAEASFAGANLMGATLALASLADADLRGSNLHGAGLWRAVLRGAHLDGAIVTGTCLAEEGE